MNISQEHKNIIMDDFKFAIEQIAITKDVDVILYYFSSIYGAVRRVMNISCDPELVYLHQALVSVYSDFRNRYTATINNQEKPIRLIDEQIYKLLELTKELYALMMENKPIDNTLKQFFILGYTCTGNGYYLYQRKKITL